MVDVHVWGACGEIRGGSSPPVDIIKKRTQNPTKWNLVKGFKREGAEGEGFLRKKEDLEAKTEDPFNATEQESPPVDN